MLCIDFVSYLNGYKLFRFYDNFKVYDFKIAMHSYVSIVGLNCKLLKRK